MGQLHSLSRPAHAATPGCAIWGAFPARDGSAIRFRVGRGRIARACSGTAAFDEVQVRKWPVAARIGFMLVVSALLWVGIAALLGAFD